MMYATYDYYTGPYGGREVNREDFERLAAKASARMAFDATGALKAYAGEDFVQSCCCAMVELMAEEERLQAQGGVLAAERRGNWSRSYHAPGGGGATRSLAARLYDLEALYLGDWGLLYRGVSQ